VFGRLLGEQLATQLIKAAGSGGGRQSIRCTHRLLSEKRPDPILHGNRARRDLATQQIPRSILELTTVRAPRSSKTI
jgi:hypothetical protein